MKKLKLINSIRKLIELATIFGQVFSELKNNCEGIVCLIK